MPANPTVVLSWGMGVDSTAVLLRWILEPGSRDFDLDDLVVVVAMVGDEWNQTGVDAAAHVLPLLRRHRIRLIQCARSGRLVTSDGDGVVVLDDSRTPTRLHIDGVYRLSDELREAGTIPQAGGARLCSVHAKGNPLERVIGQVTGGGAYRHVLGFEADELRRAEKDARYDTDLRTGAYPLIEWGWDRDACLAYIAAHTGVAWTRSACTYCPFALTSKAGRERTLARYADDPAAGSAALMLEHVALALNPRQGLIAGERLIDALRDAGHRHVLDAFTADRDTALHHLYEVRRLLRAHKDDPTKMANAARSVRTLATGTRAAMLDALAACSPDGDDETGADQIRRIWVARRGDGFPTSERFLVAAPAGVTDKQADQFEQWWREAHPTPAATVPDVA